MTALSLATLAGLPQTVARPDYDIGGVSIGIVHLGLGAFHRAHEAVYTDAILYRDPGWGICGVSLKTPRAITALGGGNQFVREQRHVLVGKGAFVILIVGAFV